MPNQPCCCCIALVVSDSVRPHEASRPWDSPGKNTGVGCHFLLQCMKGKSESEVAQLCPTLSDPLDCSLPGSSVHGIFQARVLEWGAIALTLLISWCPFLFTPPSLFVFLFVCLFLEKSLHSLILSLHLVTDHLQLPVSTRSISPVFQTHMIQCLPHTFIWMLHTTLHSAHSQSTFIN